MTYYDLLGIPPTAPPDDVHRAYRRAILRYHPDVNKAPSAAQLTMRLNEAWATLGNPRSRAAYDQAMGIGRPRPQPRSSQQQQAPPNSGRRPTPPNSGWRPPPPGSWTWQPPPQSRTWRQPPPPPPPPPQDFARQAAPPPSRAWTTVAEPFELPLGRIVGSGLRVLVLVAFVASVIHWFPLIATICAGIFFLRIFGRAFR